MAVVDDLAIARLFAITVPPLNPAPNSPRRKIVFVDPDDDNAVFFWPGLIIPDDELALFSMINPSVQMPSAAEYLVAYFEDGSLYVYLLSSLTPQLCRGRGRRYTL